MERLTERDENGTAFIVLDENSKEWSVSVDQSSYAHTIECEAVDKLADYEDAEEQGLLLRLPCKVGDTVYWLNNFYGFNNNYSVTEEVVVGMQITEDDFVIEMSTSGVKYGRIGKDVFLTKEEAEQKLAEMKGE